MSKKTTTATKKLPEFPKCWVDQQPTKSKEKLWGIWAKYNTTTKSRIEKECGQKGGQKEMKRKGTKKRKGKGSG